MSTSIANLSVGRRIAGRARPPWPLLLLAALVTLATLIPLVYLALRAFDGGLDPLAPLFRARSWRER